VVGEAVADVESSQARDESSVIRSRITVPPLPSPFVARPRIEQLLVGLIEDYQVVQVIGMAGAGKTTVLAEVASLVGRPLAWLTLDDSDVAPGRLLTYLETALASSVTSAERVATSALAAGITHREAAGLLADAVGEAAVLLVLDEIERLADATDALAVIAAIVRYAPPTMRIVLSGRSELSLDVGSATLMNRLATVTDSDLAFTVDEAATALAQAGAADVDPARAVELTGGWVAGVLFEAWRSAEHDARSGEGDPLYGYLSSQILERLPPEEREFLVATSLLDVVTVERAGALGQSEARARLASLRAKHLPVFWDAEGRSMWWNPRFREYLLDRLARRGDDKVRDLRSAHAQLLARDGHDEDAIEEFLRAGNPTEALPPADRVIPVVIERLDFAVAERWLTALGDVRPTWSPGLTTGELMLAMAGENYGQGVRIADRLASLGERGELARASSRAAALMAWFYLSAGRAEDARAVLDVAGPSSEVAALRYALTHTQEHVPEADLMVPLTGGPLDALVMRVHYYRGLLSLLVEEPASPWAAKVAEPWRILALAALGQTEQALALYERATAGGGGSLVLRALLGPELQADAGREEEAWNELRRGREQIRASGSLVLEWLSAVLEAKLQLRLHHDPEAAKTALAPVETHPTVKDFRFVLEQVDTWAGLALLLRGDVPEALVRLQRGVKSMVAGDRILLLATAAVYLAEAHRRADDAGAANRAADLALASATKQGSNHLLLQALADFPSVVSHRLQAGAESDSAWSELARTLESRGVRFDRAR
jgi:tetratricopeptide (TPR) repeat protein